MFKIIKLFFVMLLFISSVQVCYSANENTLVGSYGKNGDIHVYKAASKCAITFQGRAENFVPHGLLLWAPRLPHNLLIFPNATKFDAAINTLHALKPSIPKKVIGKDTLTLNNETTALKRIPGSTDDKPVFMYGNRASLIDSFMKNPKLSATFYDPEHLLIHTSVKFDLQGFKDALFAADAACQRGVGTGTPPPNNMPTGRRPV